MKKLLAVLLLAVSGAAFAQPYVYGAFGQSRADVSRDDLDADVTALTGIRPSSSTLDATDTGFKLLGGYQFGPNLALEAGWVDLGKVHYSANVAAGIVTEDVKASGVVVSAVGILPVSRRVNLFGKFGFINATVDASARVAGPGGSASASASSTEWKPNYGVGVMVTPFASAPALGVRAEYEWFSKLGNNDTGKADVNLLSVGLTYRF